MLAVKREVKRQLEDMKLGKSGAEKYVPVKELCVLLEVSRQTVNNWRRSRIGFLIEPHVQQVGGKVLYDVEDLKRVMREHEDFFAVVVIKFTEEALYAKVDVTRNDLPTGYPVDNYTNPNEKVAKVLGNNNSIGPSITLKVMVGDKFDIHVSSWYKTNSVTPDNPVNILTDLISAITTGISTEIAPFHQGVTPIDLQTNGNFTSSVNEFFSNHQTPDVNRPKAYLNWILFDSLSRKRSASGNSLNM